MNIEKFTKGIESRIKNAEKLLIQAKENVQNAESEEDIEYALWQDIRATVTLETLQSVMGDIKRNLK